MNTEIHTTSAASLGFTTLPCRAWLVGERSGLPFVQTDVPAGPNDRASSWHFTEARITMILGRAANDAIVTLSVVAPPRLP